MKIAIMQPYFFPYIGYWQLLNAVDTFVIYDDVNYIKKGWINRNRILVHNEAHLFTLPLKKSSQNKRICDCELSADSSRWSEKFIRQLEHAYRRSPHYGHCNELIGDLLKIKHASLHKYLGRQLRELAEQLGIRCDWLYSSEITQNRELKAHDRIIDICKQLGAQTYVNAAGGRGLYRVDDFWKNGLELRFLVGEPIQYPQFKHAFVPNLSIIDVMMFNSQDAMTELLAQCRLVEESA